jgi:RNA polymerase sigma-70 factor, ECF subfamily
MAWTAASRIIFFPMIDRPLRAVEADEETLVARLRGGDARAFEEMVRLHMPRMLRVARRFLMNEEDARDAVQDAFVSAFRSMGSFEGNAMLATWLHRIVVNASLVKLRTRRRHPEEDIEALLPRFAEDGHQSEASIAWSEPADSAIERAELANQVRVAIEKLPETYRVVLLLRDIEELSPQEVAEMLGITTNAVKVRLHRARQALRTLLDPELRGRAT